MARTKSFRIVMNISNSTISHNKSKNGMNAIDYVPFGVISSRKLQQQQEQNISTTAERPNPYSITVQTPTGRPQILLFGKNACGGISKIVCVCTRALP